MSLRTFFQPFLWCLNAILTVVGIIAQKCIIRNGEGRYFPQTLHFMMLILKLPAVQFVVRQTSPMFWCYTRVISLLW